MHNSLESYKHLTMTSSTNDQFPGFPPPPITEITMEQEFTMARLEKLLQEASKEDFITVFTALQRQCFVLGNNVKNLINKWPIHPPITLEDQ